MQKDPLIEVFDMLEMQKIWLLSHQINSKKGLKNPRTKDNVRRGGKARKNSKSKAKMHEKITPKDQKITVEGKKLQKKVTIKKSLAKDLMTEDDYSEG